MPWKDVKPRRFHIGTIAKPRFEIFDVKGNESWNITSATYTFFRRDNREVILSGACVVNNADTDRHGNTIKTIVPTLDFSNTDVEAAVNHYLSFDITLDTGETDILVQLVRMVDYEA